MTLDWKQNLSKTAVKYVVLTTVWSGLVCTSQVPTTEILPADCYAHTLSRILYGGDRAKILWSHDSFQNVLRDAWLQNGLQNVCFYNFETSCKHLQLCWTGDVCVHVTSVNIDCDTMLKFSKSSSSFYADEVITCTNSHEWHNQTWCGGGRAPIQLWMGKDVLNNSMELLVFAKSEKNKTADVDDENSETSDAAEEETSKKSLIIGLVIGGAVLLGIIAFLCKRANSSELDLSSHFDDSCRRESNPINSLSSLDSSRRDSCPDLFFQQPDSTNRSQSDFFVHQPDSNSDIFAERERGANLPSDRTVFNDRFPPRSTGVSRSSEMVVLNPVLVHSHRNSSRSLHDVPLDSYRPELNNIDTVESDRPAWNDDLDLTPAVPLLPTDDLEEVTSQTDNPSIPPPSYTELFPDKVS